MVGIGLGPLVVVLIVVAIVGAYMGIVHWFLKSSENAKPPIPAPGSTRVAGEHGGRRA